MVVRLPNPRQSDFSPEQMSYLNQLIRALEIGLQDAEDADTGGTGGTVDINGTPTAGSLTGWFDSNTIEQTDLTGDVTTSGSAATTITNNAVTLSKLATQGANTVLANATNAVDEPTAFSLGTYEALGRLAGDIIGIGIGTGANQLVQLDGTAKLPAVDGSQLTGLTGAVISNFDNSTTNGGVDIGMIQIKWGSLDAATLGSSSDVTVTFTNPFSTGILSVVATINSGTTANQASAVVKSPTASNFVLRNGNSSTNQGANWLAIGY